MFSPTGRTLSKVGFPTTRATAFSCESPTTTSRPREIRSSSDSAHPDLRQCIWNFREAQNTHRWGLPSGTPAGKNLIRLQRLLKRLVLCTRNGSMRAASNCTGTKAKVKAPITPSCVQVVTPDRPTDRPTDRPAGRPGSGSGPGLGPTNQPTYQPTYQSIGQPTNQPTNQPTSQPASQPANRPTDRPTDQPASQPASQPTSQPANQPASQPANQPVS